MSIDELNDNVEHFTENINQTLGTIPEEPERAKEWSSFCDEWGKELIKGFVEDILNETDVLYIAPHNILHRLPFHAIRINDKYLCEQVAVCYIPNSAILRRCQLQNKARRIGASYRPEKCLSVGCDTLSHNPKKQEEFCQFARDIAGHFPPDKRVVLTDLCHSLPNEEVATAENVRKLCNEQSIDLLSFFCHGTFNQHDPLHSVLHLPPNGISVLDIMTQYRMGDLVTLIGCTTAKPNVQQGDEVYSLSMAMLFSGAASITGALWMAHAPAARVFFDRFISSWLAGTPKGLAFQEAQKYMIRNEKFSHPYHWAPYIFIGDWA